MILNNKFYIDNLKNVVFLGESEVFEELIEINDTFDIKTLVVTSSHQAHAIEKNIKKNIFGNINTFDEHYTGATTYLNNGNFGKLFIKKCHLHGGDSSNHPFMAGIVTRHDTKWIVVSTSGKHMLLIKEVLDTKGKNILSLIKPGDRFFTPDNKLEYAKKNRIIYSSKGKKH